MPQSFKRHTISFILRLWVEPIHEARLQWRGQIEHVDSGETIHFQVPTSLLTFLIAHLSAPDTGVSTELTIHEEDPYSDMP